jgi:hypothetical protein
MAELIAINVVDCFMFLFSTAAQPVPTHVGRELCERWSWDNQAQTDRTLFALHLLLPTLMALFECASQFRHNALQEPLVVFVRRGREIADLS